MAAGFNSEYPFSVQHRATLGRLFSGQRVPHKPAVEPASHLVVRHLQLPLSGALALAQGVTVSEAIGLAAVG